MKEIERSLIAWCSSFNTTTAIDNLADLADGIIVNEILNQIEPDYFPLKSINQNAKENWALGLHNLKKIFANLQDYFQDKSGVMLGAEMLDLTKIARHRETQEILNLLELVIGVVVECTKKEYYIGQILKLPESVQGQLMPIIESFLNKIQQMKTNETLHDQSGDSLNRSPAGGSENELRKLTHKVEQLKAENVMLTQNLELLSTEKEELAGHVKDLSETNKRREIELEELKKKYAEHKETTDSQVVNKELEEVLSIKEKYISELETQYQELFQKYEEDIEKLKDELDLKNEENYQLKKLEATVGVYKQKLENLTPYKQKCMELENVLEYYKTRSTETSSPESSNRTASSPDKLRRELITLKERNGQLEEDLDVYKEEVATLQVENEGAESKILLLREDIEHLKERLDSQEADKMTFINEIGKNDMNSLQSSLIEDLQGQIRELERENRDMHDNLVNGGSIQDVKYQDVLKERARLVSSNKELKTKVKTLEQEAEKAVISSEAQEQLKTLSGQCDKYSLENTALKDTLTTTQAEVQKLTREKDAIYERYIKDKDAETALTAQIAMKEASNVETMMEISRLKSKISELESSERSACDQLTALKTENLLAAATVSTTTTSSRSRGGDLDESERKRMVDTEKENIRLTAKVEKAEMRYEELSRRLNEAEHGRVEAEQLIHEKDDALEEMKEDFHKQIAELEEELEDRTEECEYYRQLQDDSKEVIDREEKLLASVFYGIGGEIQRRNVRQLQDMQKLAKNND